MRAQFESVIAPEWIICAEQKMIGADDFLRAAERAWIAVYSVIPEIFCLDAWRRGGCRQEMILQLVEAGDEERGETAQGRDNNFDFRKAGGDICRREFWKVNGGLCTGAERPEHLSGPEIE